jgi:hypothetical protein
MKTHNHKIKILSISMAVLSASLLSVNTQANEKPVPEFEEQMNPQTHPATGQPQKGALAELIYNDPARGPAIYSYPGSVPEKTSDRPELTYVSLAYGPAIYSYPHSGTEKTVPLNIEYVDKAYGPAIYSYDRVQVPGKVTVFSILFD